MPIPSSIDIPPASDRPFLLTKVEGAFGITGRGVVVVPAFPKGGCQFLVRVGDFIEIRRCDGASTKTYIRGIEHLKLVKGGSQWGLLLPQEFTDSDVPIGTEVWWMAPAAKKGSE